MLFGLTAAPSQAQTVTFVTSQAALGGNDSINWESYGYADNAFPGGTNLKTSRGIGFNITDPITPINFDPRGPVEIADQTDFTPTESAQSLRIPYLNPYAQISINFLKPASAVGALLENRNANHSIGPTFTGYVNAYDGNTLLGSFSEMNTIQNLPSPS